eukprot:m.47537 g.47537  ORF g.47537 m.47537 type:complete len:460 (-) comp20515_c0_seq1:62-1441(-)
MSRLTLMVVTLLLGCVNTMSQVPPKMTPFQQGLWQNADKAAAIASAIADSKLLELLEEKEFRSQLLACCGSELANTPAPTLLSLLKQEFMVAEMTHNFHANSSGTWEGDVDINVAANMSYLPNLWTIMYLKISPYRTQKQEDYAEVNLMGFRPFTGGHIIGNSTPPSFDEAAERPFYTTSNLLHIDAGDPTFGDVSMVVSPSYGWQMALIQPCDTGNWEDSCNVSSGHQPQACHYPQPLNCSAWDRQQGTYDHFSHILLANINMWDSGKNCTSNVLARYFARLYGNANTDSELYKLEGKDFLTFIEPDLAGTVRYPEGIKLVVASFTSLFGTENGRKVQEFCRMWGWMLTWALSTNSAESFDVDLRVIDPHVFDATTAKHNMTISADARGHFADLWQTVNASGSNLPPTTWTSHWMSLPQELRLSAGIRARDCEDVDSCVGVSTHSNMCVCYANVALAV